MLLWLANLGNAGGLAVTPPIFSGTIPDISLTEGGASTDYDLSTYFTGAISYSITPAVESGWAFNTATGVLTVNPTVAATFGPYVVTATNPGGTADSNSFGVIVALASLPGGSSDPPLRRKKETKEELNKELLLFYTGINNRSNTILTEQKRKTQDNLHILDKMVKLSEELRKALENNDLTEFGNILHEGWIYKRKLASKMTNPFINEYYEKARKAGAIGGKILGAGGGGFLLFYCEEKNQNKVRKALSNLKEAAFKFEPQASRIIYVSD